MDPNQSSNDDWWLNPTNRPPGVDNMPVVRDGSPFPAAMASAAPQSNNVGHDGNYNGMNREQWRDAWMGQGSMATPAADAWLQSHGATKLSDNGTYMTPYGEVLDLQIGAKSGTTRAGWTDTGGGGGNAGSGGAGSGFNNGGASSAGSQWDDLYNQLLSRSKQTLTVGRNDPTVRAQADAYSANTDRAARQSLMASAERGSPYGTGAQQGQERMLAENAGQANGAFEAQLMAREVTARRDEIQNALTQMGGMLSLQQQLAMQKELAELNAEIQRQGLNQNQSQFNSTLAFNTDDRNNYWDSLRRGLL